jgi:D-alanyl-D-alanine carboxypeptidase (penicillin-binding protein 5/6)
LIDASTGQVLFEKNADVPRPPASTTKIMTAILLLESLAPDEIITASKAANETGGSSLSLAEGESITARDMLYALMLRSANDGCVAVAERIAGSEARFVEMMNEKARQIGCTRTRFVNCNGLNCDGHVTTARDLANMARYASRYPEFNEATRSKTRQITRSTASKDFVLKNHAKFLWKFPGADGVKTGWTVPAGRCFVGSATWNGWRLISVVLNSPDMVGETSLLMKYGFSKFERIDAGAPGAAFGSVSVDGGDPGSVPALLKEPLRIVRPKGGSAPYELRTVFDSVSAPIDAGAKVGVVEARFEGKTLGSGILVAASPVARSAMVAATGRGQRWYLWLAALVGLIGLRYGSSYSKAARIRRHRLKAVMRGVNRRG